MVKASKGSAFERDICKYLSNWINGSEKPYVFWRGRGSGAMFTVSNSIGEAFSGDIYCVRPEGKFLTDKFSIELKNGYPATSLDKFFKENKSDPFESAWAQCVNDATIANKYPMLIFKKKGLGAIWLCISKDTYNSLNKYFKDIRYLYLNFNNNDLLNLYMFEMNKFFEVITKDIIENEIQI
jgi:hypothetical protein